MGLPRQKIRRALPAPLDGIFPGSDYLGPTSLISVLDTDPRYLSGTIDDFKAVVPI
jgi:hypothetical protein